MTIDIHSMTIHAHNSDNTTMIADWRDTESDAAGFASVIVPTDRHETPRWEVGSYDGHFEVMKGTAHASAPAHWKRMKSLIQSELAHFHVSSVDTYDFEHCESIADVRDTARAHGWEFISSTGQYGTAGSPFMHVSEFYSEEWHAKQGKRYDEVATLYCLDELSGDTWCVVAR